MKYPRVTDKVSGETRMHKRETHKGKCPNRGIAVAIGWVSETDEIAEYTRSLQFSGNLFGVIELNVATQHMTDCQSNEK